MIDQKQIPPEVVEAAIKAFWEANTGGITTYQMAMSAAIVAALAAWPGAETWTDNKPARLILPLTEARDDK